MADFLLELLSEEIPARMQDKAREDLARLFAAEIAKSGLAATSLETFATPRRLALIARGLPMATEAVSEETKGPKASAPPQALEGFLRKTGLTREQLVERDGVLFAIVEKSGRTTAQVLAEAIPAIVRAFPWPKSMRWGDASSSTASLRWVRPLQGIVALLGEDVVPFEIDGIASGAATVGHRFRHPGQITIGSADDYAAKLRACHVIVDQAERQRIVQQGAEDAAAARGLTLVPDPGLVSENAGLTEWPVPLLGEFDPAFLEVPREVIQLTMRTNQKYFACTDASGTLAPAFVCTANIDALDGGAAIVAGNRKVLAARLSDAKFFWEQDLKVSLEEQARKLDQIVFHEKLGTVADRVRRINDLALSLVQSEVVKPIEDTPQAKTALHNDVLAAASLSKADLVTGMVGEFPELQGIMGGYYARAEGMSDATADAIRDHYKPVGQGDSVPTAPATVAVSLAEKLDSLLAFFAVDERPTGSKDPFALRRAGLGVIALLEASSIRLSLASIAPRYLASLARQISAIKLAESGYGSFADDIYEDWLAGRPFERHPDGTITRFQEGGGRIHYSLETQPFLRLAADTHDAVMKSAPALLPFLTDRLKVQQREAGVRLDLIDAVFALGGEDDLVRLLARVKALQIFVATEDGANLLAGYKRAANILRIEEKKDGASFSILDDTRQVGEISLPEEQDLLFALENVEPMAAKSIGVEDFEGAMRALAALRAPVDAFFDKVTVNDSEPARRFARLHLLARFRDACNRVADFSRIEG